MLEKVLSYNFLGIDSFIVEVEVDISNGLPYFNIVGLGDITINESKERIRSGLKNMGYMLEPRKITVNLTPANIRKYGSHFDLPIAIGILSGMKLINDFNGKLVEYIILGELSLTGEVRRADGVIAAAILAKEKGFKGIIIPEDNIEEAAIIDGIDIVAVKNIRDVANFFESGKKRNRRKVDIIKFREYEKIDIVDIKGQEKAKRALEISASGGHNIIFVGSPGSGKSMLAKRMITILPEMSDKEKIETTKIYSLAGELSNKKPLILERPFRSPHHTATISSILGGGRVPRPGEVSLANNGILFFDEYTEFKGEVIQALREVLEKKEISIIRQSKKVVFPSNIIFIAAANPCFCGNLFEEDMCVCTPYDIRRYSKRLIGPVIDRIDLYVEMKRLSEEEMLSKEKGETSAEIRERVKKAREIQRKRFGNDRLNSDMSIEEIEKYCKIDSDGEKIVREAIRKLKLSMRTYHKILKIARTIADMDGREKIEKIDLLEAINYRK